MSTPDLPSLLDLIEHRAEAATPGPWETLDTSIVTDCNIPEPKCIAVIETDGGYECDVIERLANQLFIAAARNDVPALVKALRRAIKAMDDMPNTLRDIDAILSGEAKPGGVPEPGDVAP